MNKVKIMYNPYENEIEYRKWNIESEEWQELGAKSELIRDTSLAKTNFQHAAEEILEHICKEYNHGNIGVEIIFEGTREDYLELNKLMENAYSEQNIECKEGALYLESSKEVMSKIQIEFEELHGKFNEFNNPEIVELLEDYEEVVSAEIPICVMGNYSEGKSAFINSLIGEEILVSHTEPTTARNFKIIKITAEEMPFIKLYIKGNEAKISFKGKRIVFDDVLPKELIDRVNEEVERIAQNNQEIGISKRVSTSQKVYASIKSINAYANDMDKQDSQEVLEGLIEVNVHFNGGILSESQHRFVIYDTPGSDSASNNKHDEVLAEAIKEQTNGLPILLTTADNMDNDTAQELIEAVEKKGDQLDLENVMIVVNKADAKIMSVLTDLGEKENTVFAKWKSNRLYFVSSIMGLGSKKEYCDAWLDEEYDDVYEDNEEKFSNINHRRYKELYKCNQMSPLANERYKEELNNNDNLVYKNSGLHCVESEIIAFAERFALYNKCDQAQEFLREIVEKLKENVSVAAKNMDRASKQTEELLSDGKQKLTKAINAKATQVSNEVEAGIVEIMSHKVSSLQEENKKYVGNLVELASNLGRNSEMSDEEYLKKQYNYIMKELEKRKDCISKELVTHIQKFLKDKEKQLCDECLDLINDTEELTEEESTLLKKYILNIEKTSVDVNADIKLMELKKIRTYWFFFTKITNDLNLYMTQYRCNEYLDKVITDTNHDLVDKNKKSYQQWKNKLKNGIVSEVANLNPELKQLTRNLEMYQKQLSELEEAEIVLISSNDRIEGMFEYKGRE